MLLFGSTNKSRWLGFFGRSFVFARHELLRIFLKMGLWASHSLDLQLFLANHLGFGFVDPACEGHALAHLRGCLLQGVEHAINPTRATKGCRCEPSDSPWGPGEVELMLAFHGRAGAPVWTLERNLSQLSHVPKSPQDKLSLAQT